MKRNITHIALFLYAALSFLFLLPFSAEAQVQWTENFDYPDGELYGQGGWVRYGSNPNDPIQVVDQTLQFDGYPGGVTGKSVKMIGDALCQDLAYRFEPSKEGITSGNLYFTALIQVSEPPTESVYSFSLLTSKRTAEVVDGKSPTELGRIFFDAGSDAQHYRLGVERGSTNPVWTSAEYEVGKTYLIVLKYEMVDPNDDDKVSLFVNPASFREEPVADAEIQGSSGTKRSSGFQGVELRQAGSSTKKAPAMLVGALRVADTYAGLFQGGSVEPEVKPQITLSESSLNFNAVYQGETVQKSINLKAANLVDDIHINFSSDELAVSVNTITAAEAQQSEGVDITFTLTPVSQTGNADITFSSKEMPDKVLKASWYTIPVYEKKTLKEFVTENPDDYYTYLFNGDAVVSFVDKSGDTPKYYIQDATAGMVLQGYSDYNLREGDKLSPFKCTITSSFGVITLVPNAGQDPTAVSSGNTLTPVEANLAAIKSTPSEYLNRLVLVKNAQFSNIQTGDIFSEGMAQPVITDESGEGKVRIFKGTSLIGTAIPTGKADIVGLSTSVNAVIIAPRSAADITEIISGPPALEVTPTKVEMKHGYVGKSTELWTIHIKADNLPGETVIDITGTNRNLFSASATSLPAGSSETDIVITYTPDKIGKHSARLNIDCQSVPELTTAVSLSAYATDEQNPPRITVSPESIPAFSAEAGKTQEQTITVTTAFLPDFGNMKLKTADAFRLSTTMLLKDNEAQVTITFAPKKEGKFNNEIEFSALGLETFTVSITGTATASEEPKPEKEGDDLPLDLSSPRTLLHETFDNVEKNKPLKLEGWKNLAMKGQRAWWGHLFADTDESAGEKVAKVTPFDGNIEIGEEEDCEMLLVTPVLDFKKTESKIFTFRVRGDFLRDEQTDLLELCYIDASGDQVYIEPINGITMPAIKDLNGEWSEYHVDLSNSQLADVFFMGFRFQSQRGRENSTTYYIDDVSYGRTDLPVIYSSTESESFVANPNKDASSNEISITTRNLTQPVKLTIGGANKSKFKLSTQELPVEGGSFRVLFNSDVVGIHEAYVKLSSRGAADKYILLSVDCTNASGITGPTLGERVKVSVYDTTGRLVSTADHITVQEATNNLVRGTYILKLEDNSKIEIKKINIH